MADNKRHDEIVGMIEEFIKSGNFKVGDRIPSERFLAEKFQVSRNTVREAIKSLTEKAVVTSRRGAGTYIAEGAFNCMIEAVTRQNLRLKEIFELRKILEPQIARLAAERISDEHIKEIDTIVKAQQTAFASGKNSSEMDETFHRLIVKATGNSVLSDIYETLHDVLAESRAHTLQTTERNKLSLESHKNLAWALKQRSPDIVEELMREHMEQVEKNLEAPAPKKNKS
ncbi:FadR/GntR family transcriptional regulator [Desulfosediminicola flagellatus]|uniref:FadR/GntR family transcriptional regulator n=1 Tax=Desulfosediminicola flagellatus TaxID=2569541 RepID=UPI0010ABA19A|nr:FadR/GntR family transcriptional regulator [Desulfosediminicola flagellatus]